MKRVYVVSRPDPTASRYERGLYQFRLADDPLVFSCSDEQGKVHDLQNEFLDLVEATPFTEPLREALLKMVDDLMEAAVEVAREEARDEEHYCAECGEWV